jgi:DNA-binding XRE family transcriptional regulator
MAVMQEEFRSAEALRHHFKKHEVETEYLHVCDAAATVAFDRYLKLGSLSVASSRPTASARNLRRYRLAAGLSQEAVAERMGVDRAHVSSMERGQQNVTLLTVWETAQALGRTSAEFLDEDAAAAAVVSGKVVKAPRRRRTKS